MPDPEHPGRRQYPRQKVFAFCRVVWSSQRASYQVPAMTLDVSLKGLAVLLRNPAQPIWMEATVHILKDLELRVMPVYTQPWLQRVAGTKVGFNVKQVISGEHQWEKMCNGAGDAHSVVPRG